MKNSQETAESLDHLAEKAHLGVAWVRLDNLKYEPPPGRPFIPLQSRKINFLLDEFRDQGCFPNVRRNRIQAKISQSVLAQVLGLSRLTVDDLQDSENLRQLDFPEGIVLTHAHGQHRLEAARLEAARQQVDPHTVCWAVDLLNEDDLNTQFDVGEQNRNIESTPHNDGAAFCFRDADESWRRKGFGSKRVEVDLKAIEKRPALYAALTALRPFVGLWYSFKKATLERINCLKCDDELIRYLDGMKNTWMFIIDNDLELADKIDESTVDLIEATAPMVSLADKEDIVQGFRDGTIFRQVGDGATRMRLQRNVLAVKGMISSITTFLADTLYLEESHLAMKVLIDPTTYQTRKALRLMWHASQSNHVVLEYVDGLKEATNASIEEECQFQVAYIQLWMFAMRNYPRLTRLFPKTDSKHKVPSTGPDPEWLRKFAAFAKALGFVSTAINRLLEEDPDFVNVRDMLSKARPPNRFVYDVQSQTRSHCELLRRIRETQPDLGWNTKPVWTTEASKIQKKRRYGRSFERALEECKPFFFLHNMSLEPPPSSGRYFTDLFVKRSMLQSFFQVPVLPVALSLRRITDLGIVLERDNLPRKRLREDDVVKQHNAAAEQAMAQRQLEEENNISKDRLSKAENILAGHLAQIRDYEKRDRQSKETIEGLKRTIEDHASASKMQVGRERGSEVASLESRLAAQSLLIKAFQSSIGEPMLEETIATKLANKITDLELNIQTQNTELKRYEQGATTLRMINIRLKKTREAVETISSAIRQLQLEPSSDGSDCELQSEELSAIGEQLSEVDDLEKSIWNFITLYSQNSLPQDENGWQKPAPGERLALEDKIGSGVEIDTLDLERMIALVSRRVKVVYDLRSELVEARESQRLNAELVARLEGELNTARDLTQENETAAMANLKAELSLVKTGSETLRKEAEQLHNLEANAAKLSQQLVKQSTEAHNAKQISSAYKKRIDELEIDGEEMTRDLRNKTKTLDIITLMIKKTRNGVEKASAVFSGRLQPEQDYEELGLLEDLPNAEQFDEIEDLEKSIWNFIALYNLGHDGKALERQVPGEWLAIEDVTGAVVDTGTPDLKQMLTLVSKRAADLEQGGRAILDLRAELNEAKIALESHRLKAERLECLEAELAGLKGQLQQEQVAITRLEEEAKRARGVEADLRAALQTAEDVQVELKETLEEVKKAASSNWEDLESTKSKLKNSGLTNIRLRNKFNKADRLVVDLMNKLEDKERFITSLTSGINDGDERIKSLKEQLSETYRLIGLEENKMKFERGQKRIRAAKNQPNALNIQNLVQQEADAESKLSQVEEQMVDARLKILTHAKHKLRLQHSRTAPQTNVEYFHVNELEQKIEKLHGRGKMIYCFVNKGMVVVEHGNYKNFLANPKSLADHGEFFSCDRF
ncbi:hypothetical protein O988_02795 [Pseudogymnoascus sp. VKM F-3808]|nr:hypothetical protein O988_02795 [Pseudogymnoascus sp. VKM F-3808]